MPDRPDSDVRDTPAPPLHIRDARPDEIGAIRRLTVGAYAEYAATMPAALWRAYRKAIVRTLDGQGPVQRIVAELDGEGPVGTVLLFAPSAAAYGQAADGASWPEVRLLAVRPQVRGRGVGATLMEACARRACLAGAGAVGLHTMDVMEAAVRLYDRLGYVRTPERDFSPLPGVVVKGYRLDLDGCPPASAGGRKARPR